MLQAGCSLSDDGTDDKCVPGVVRGGSSCRRRRDCSAKGPEVRAKRQPLAAAVMAAVAGRLAGGRAPSA